MSEARLENCTQVCGVGQIWTACDSWLRKNSASYAFWLVQTCQNLSEPVRNTVTMYARRAMSSFCTFQCSYSSVLRPIVLKLHILTHLMESFAMVYELWRCIEVKMSIPRRSPCLKTVQRKSFQRGTFLMLRPVLLKNAYFNSANG